MEDITDFLPKYPNINKVPGKLLNPYEENFYEAVYSKKEFYDNKLSPTEEFPDKVGTLMKHQKLIARFFSSHTPYNELLLVHEMGSGKTCTAVGAIEQIRSEGGGFRGALYLAKGDALINNFINELIFKCTDGRYIPEGYDDLTELEKVHRKKKAIKDYYSTNTFETFAKEIQKSSDTELRKKYDNRIIIIDEVHNLRIQDDKETGLNIYNQFHRFLHVVQNCKILLMSGTPMKDNVDEIASVMNLILPLDNQLPTGDEFLSVYFDAGKDGSYTVKSSKIKALKKVFKGRVSYLNAMQSEITKVYMGGLLGTLKHIKVIQDTMSDFQSKHYNTAYESDRTERKGVYSKSRQAALFVFPDGSSGDAGFTKYVKKVARSQAILDNGKKRRMYNYVLAPELVNAIRAPTHEEMLVKLSRFSSKYAESIRNILNAQKEGKSIFIYNEYVQGSGLILFGLLLELFGFTKASGSELNESEKPRYASLTNLTATTKQVRQLVDRFNQPDNMHGDIIRVMMGSRKIAEGFSLQNVQIEEIHTPWFNYSETAQALARGLRLGSHRVLLAAGLVPKIQIYQRISVPTGVAQKPSIDLEMYEISEIKDISIKGVERLMKEAAWDCGLNYERNHVIGRDGERECDYMDCDYTCDGLPTGSNGSPEPLENRELDYSTFQLYYAKENVQRIIDKLVEMFRDNFRMDLDSIIDYFPEYSGFELITALRTMINESIQIINKYGYPSYIQEENNIFFLIDSLTVTGKFSSDYYTEFPHVKKPMTFSQIVQPLYFESLPAIVEQINTAKNINDIRKIIIRLPKQVHEYLLEGSILARKKGVERNAGPRALILEYFENYYKEFDGVWVSWLLYDDEEILRCLEGDKWKDCGSEYVEIIDKSKRKHQANLETNPYGYYGQFNRETEDFCIRDVSEDIPEKKHLRTSGKRCINWKKPDLIPVLINKLKIPIPDDDKMDRKELNKWVKTRIISRERIWSEIQKNKYVKDLVTNEAQYSTDDLLRILFWGQQQLKSMCVYIRDWFESQGLLVEDPGCGQMGKLKI